MGRRPRLLVAGAALALVTTGFVLRARQQSIPVAQEFESLHFRSLGPATMSGRIADLAVYEASPAVYYAATAHGGLWKTSSNGALFEPLFQDQGLISLGDVTISQRNPDLVWVGAGESNNRQSTSWGGGIWKSTDGGRTFTHAGLANSKHINRIVIHPQNEDIVLVAATGPLFGPGGDRGVYRTTDGGRTWQRVLGVDDDTGANDLVMAATDPDIVYATTYQRRRTACCMNGGGPGSAIWKSTDGGVTWSRLAGGGLPEGPLGRIALDIFRRNANTVYAMIEGPSVGRGGGRGGAEETPDSSAAGRGGRGAQAGGGRAGGPGSQQQGVTGVYRSDDGGRTWTRTSTTNPRPMYFSQIRIDPGDPERVYMGGVGLHLSIDGGKNFVTDAAQSTHDDVHAIWINPADPDHVLIGNDGGLAVSWDRSRTWTFLPNLPVGLFYHVSYDMERPFNICGGMQDNYNWCGPSASRQNRGIMNYDWFQIQGGDGFVAMPDPRDSRIIYTESQGGNMIRRNKVTGESKSIRPNSNNVGNFTRGDSYRWNWDTPMILSPHDAGLLLVAANRLFRSTDRGDSWTVISPDLTTNADRNAIVTMGVRNSETNIARNDGVSNWSTLVTIAESPVQPGVYWTGSDDGVVSMSRDGGRTWQNVTSRLAGFPQNGYVSEVVPSAFEAGTVYVTVDNHLHNDYGSNVWMSDDFGATFRSITGNLRGENVRTLTEDHRNSNVLYIGTETGIFLSLDRGATWRRLKANLPTVRVDEITLHPRDNAMLVASHGRGLWVLDHLEPIQEYAAAHDRDATLFTIPTALLWKSLDNRNDEFWGHQFFAGENPPTEAVIHYNLRSAVNALRLHVADAAGVTVREIDAPDAKRQPGIQTLCWDMRTEPIPVQPPAAAPAGRGAAGAAAQAGRGGQQAGGAEQAGRGGVAAQEAGRGGRGGASIPGVPTAMPDPGYKAADPCDSGAGGPGGGGGRGGGGGASAGPHVMPGTYNVALVVNGSPVATRPLDLVMDPEVRMTLAEHTRYNTILADLHETQRAAAPVVSALNALHPQMADIAEKIGNRNDVPADVRSQFQALNGDYETVRVLLGVPTPPQGGGRGGGGGFGGGGSVDPANVLASAIALKSSIMAFWEPPGRALVRQYEDVVPRLSRAITDATAILARASAMTSTLARYDLTLIVSSTR
ncbi:MAG: hypothetical protein L0271_08765 [Gemmatimonadetes bacterium]|nr:hypothetical protein [Gemmatimonadota bacterium]